MNVNKPVVILAIETSCDDTSVAVIKEGYLLSSIIASQQVHAQYGGVVPELASRAHQLNILPVVHTALKDAHCNLSQISSIAYTRGPGLLGSLLVGTSFAKGLSIALNIPLIDVNHLQGHVMSLFINPSVKWYKEKYNTNPPKFIPPPYPFLCLLVSGGNSQIVCVKKMPNAHLPQMEIVGQTIDDAAGETFDKCAKMLGLPYPGGPIIDLYAQQGNATAFTFARPHVPALDYSFSGLKTSFLYFLRDHLQEDEHFIEKNIYDLCASLQFNIISILMDKLDKARKKYGIKNIALAGGVSANNALRNELTNYGKKNGCQIFLPLKFFTTDNAAMIAQVGYCKYLDGSFSPIDAPPFIKTQINT